MALTAYQAHTHQLCRSMGWDGVPLLHVWMMFTEEVGELASAIRQYTNSFSKRKQRRHGVDLLTEFGDVFSYLFQLSHMLIIDLDAMYCQHHHRARAKIYPTTSNNEPWVCGEGGGAQPHHVPRAAS